MHPLIYVPRRRLVLPYGLRGLRNANNLVASCGECGSAGSIGSGGSPWSPASEFGTSGVWLDADYGVTLATQPSTTGWAGASWAGSGLGPYTHTAGDATALAHAALLTVGLRVRTVFAVSGRTAGSVTYYAGTTAGTARSTNTTFDEELVCAGNTTHSFVPSADFDGVVTVTSVTHLNSTLWTPRASNGLLAGSAGNVSQLSAGNMPWRETSGNGIRFAVEDYVNGWSKANTRWLHDGTGVTMIFVVRLYALPAAAAFIVNSLGNGLSVGADVYVGPGGVIEYRVANALGAATYTLQATSAAGVVAADGAPRLITCRMSAAAGNEIRRNGTQVAVDATPVSFGAGDSTHAPALSTLSALVGNYGLLGSLEDAWLTNRYITDVGPLERHFAAKHGIALP